MSKVAILIELDDAPVLFGLVQISNISVAILIELDDAPVQYYQHFQA